MNAQKVLSVLLATLFINVGLASAQSVADDRAGGVNLRGDASVEDSQPGVADDIGPNDTREAKLAKLDRQRAKREVQRERALAGLAANDPKRAEINARFDRHLSQLADKQARIEARGDDRGVDAPGDIRREDRQADRQADRRADRRADRVERSERAERAERPERAERVERVERVERPERIEQSTND